MSDEEKKLAVICQRLGAPPAQAATMAAQLWKRSEQLARERGIERAAALAYLVELVMRGRNGEAPPDFPPPRAPNA